MTKTLTRFAARLLATITLAVVVAGAALPAAAQQTEFSVSFRYDSNKSAEDNYRGFVRQSERACLTSGLRPLAQTQLDRACVDDLMDKLVARMGRTQLALVHLERTGRSIVDSRTFAAR